LKVPRGSLKVKQCWNNFDSWCYSSARTGTDGDRYLHEEQEDFAHEVQPPPPCDGVNLPPLLEPKTENFFATFFPPHDGQDTLTKLPRTSRSNSWLQRLQTNSKIGTGVPSRS